MEILPSAKRGRLHFPLGTHIMGNIGFGSSRREEKDIKYRVQSLKWQNVTKVMD